MAKIRKGGAMNIVTVNVKKNTEKPGRILIPFSNEVIAQLLNNTIKWMYVVDFLNQKTIAGNHYHEKKREFLACVKGLVEVALEDPKTKERETFHLNADPQTSVPNALVVPSNIAHAVRPLSCIDNCPILLVFSTGEPRTDDIEYQIL